MATFRTCDMCREFIPRGVKPHRIDVSDGTRALTVREQSARRIHGELCAKCAERVVAFVRGGGANG